ncbi:MAG: hypothetical protein BWY67_00740 [Bacteroidetes bacterium ADurb.Bin397]|nr:MAG: hypothetical protein BWY67_00740 [Bacteroidetes bacterium ADurb.Bin397]
MVTESEQASRFTTIESGMVRICGASVLLPVRQITVSTSLLCTVIKLLKVPAVCGLNVTETDCVPPGAMVSVDGFTL